MDKIIALQKIDGIYDIQPIITPAFSTFELSILVVMFFLLTAVNIYLLWRFVFSRRAKSKRKIHKLQQKYSQNIISTHDAIYDLCQILGKGLKQKQLNINCPPEKNIKDGKPRWNIFIERLSNSRYKKESNTPFDIAPLFEESLFWLKQ